MTEQEKIKLGLKEYDPNDEVGLRAMLTNQMGVKDSDIGWEQGTNGGTVTIGGMDFMDVGADNIRDGRSFVDAGSLSDALKNYSNTYGYDFNEKKADANNLVNMEYISPYASELDDLYQQITHFDYDPDDDPAYEAMEDRYQAFGQKAMSDVLGAASSLTGGRLNSHAQVASQDVYNDYMGELAGQIPVLANQKLGELYNLYNMVMGRDANDYNRFVTERDFDLGNIRYGEETAKADQRYENETARADEQWQYQKDWDQKMFDNDNAWREKDYQLRAYNTYKSGSGSGTKSGDYTAGQLSKYERTRQAIFSGESRYGNDNVRILQTLEQDKDKLIADMGKDLYQALVDEAMGYSNAPSSDDIYGSILGSFRGMSNEDILNELKVYAQDYVADLGYEGYQELFDRVLSYVNGEYNQNQDTINNEQWSMDFLVDQERYDEKVEKETRKEQDDNLKDIRDKLWQNYGDDVAARISDVERNEELYVRQIGEENYNILLNELQEMNTKWYDGLFDVFK